MVIDDANVPNDENEKKTIVGFKVTPYEHKILKQYAEIFYNQKILDPNTKQRRKTLRTPRGWIADQKYDLFIFLFLLLFLLLSISTIYDFLVALYESFSSLIPSRKYTSIG
jgi:hypothetical protein